MYSKHPVNDCMLFVKAFLSNQLAKLVPSLYVKLTRQTGRGNEEETASEIANYFIQCFDEYFERIGVSENNRKAWLQGKTILEYGPGDILGVAVLMYAHGAESVHCVDRFPLAQASEKNIAVYKILLESLSDDRKLRANQLFLEKGRPESGFSPDAVQYLVTKDGLSGKYQTYDLIISRAVLEHVNDIEKTLLDICGALKKNGVSIHQVDLKSHGLDRYQDFDFLTWPELLYRLMYSHKGFPNRWRVDKYENIVTAAGMRLKELSPTGTLELQKIKFIQPKLAKSFRHIPTDRLSWLGFWMILEHA